MICCYSCLIFLVLVQYVWVLHVFLKVLSDILGLCVVCKALFSVSGALYIVFAQKDNHILVFRGYGITKRESLVVPKSYTIC